jgi:hypothetical protein
MLKCIKRRCVDEEEDSENERKLSEPRTSKAEKGVTDKKILLYSEVTWPWVVHGLETKIVHSLLEKTIKYGYGLGKVKSTLHN